MARTSNNGGESKTTKTAAKAPARRRTDKTRQAANDSTTAIAAATVSLTGAHDTPSPAEVQRRAYELYVRRGCCDGYDKEDWYEAERQLKQQH